MSRHFIDAVREAINDADVGRWIRPVVVWRAGDRRYRRVAYRVSDTVIVEICGHVGVIEAGYAWRNDVLWVEVRERERRDRVTTDCVSASASISVQLLPAWSGGDVIIGKNLQVDVVARIDSISASRCRRALAQSIKTARMIVGVADPVEILLVLSEVGRQRVSHRSLGCSGAIIHPILF